MRGTCNYDKGMSKQQVLVVLLMVLSAMMPPLYYDNGDVDVNDNNIIARNRNGVANKYYSVPSQKLFKGCGGATQ